MYTQHEKIRTPWEEEVSIPELLGHLFRQLRLILLSGLFIGSVVFFINVFFLEPSYCSSTRVYIHPAGGISEERLTYSQVQTWTALTEDFCELAKSRSVLEEALMRTGQGAGQGKRYEDLYARTSVSSEEPSRLIVLSVTASSPSQARDLAGAVREVSSEHMREVTGMDMVIVIDEANLPDDPCGPRILYNSLLGILGGAFGAVFLLAAVYVCDDTVRTPEDFDRIPGLCCLGVIPMGKVKTRRRRK